MDLRDLQAFLGSSHPALHVKDRLADAPVADLTILALAAAEQPSDDRRSYLSANLASLRRVAPEIARIASSAGTVLVLSNPVDVLATCLWRLTDIDPRRIVGYSLNDTVRFRGAVARVLGVDTVRVDAYVLGEHGGLQVPLLSAVRVDGDPVPLRDEQRKAVLNDITTWFKRWNRLKSGRSSAWMTPVGCLHLIEAMAGHGVVPASVWAGSELDLTQCYITLLARLGPGGLEHVESLSLDDDERAALIGAAVEVRRAASEALTQGE
jgi:malate/lactate dehydrogenase